MFNREWNQLNTEGVYYIYLNMKICDALSCLIALIFWLKQKIAALSQPWQVFCSFSFLTLSARWIHPFCTVMISEEGNWCKFSFCQVYIQTFLWSLTNLCTMNSVFSKSMRYVTKGLFRIKSRRNKQTGDLGEINKQETDFADMIIWMALWKRTRKKISCNNKR